MSSSIQNIALIGTGMVADVHLQSLVDLAHKLKLTGVVARRMDSASAFATKASDATHSTVTAYSSVTELIANESLDWALVITPPNARMPIVSELADHGLGVLLEKPVERNLKAAEALVAHCESRGVPLGVVFQHRMREASRTLAAMIESGVFGDLVLAEVSVPWWREQSYYDEPGRGTYERDGGGVLISQAIHTLDLLMSLTGPVIEVAAMATTTTLHTMESEDFVSASLRFANGAVGSLIASTAHFPGDAESISLHFTNAVVRLKSGVLSVAGRDGRTETFGATATTGGGADPMAFTHTWHRDIIEDFSDAVRTEGAPCVTGREALRVHALIDALIESSATKQVSAVQTIHLEKKS